MQKLNHRKVEIMFNESILESIFCDDRTKCVPIAYQSTMIHVIEDTLDNYHLTYDEKSIKVITEQLRKENEECYHK